VEGAPIGVGGRSVGAASGVCGPAQALDGAEGLEMLQGGCKHARRGG
jgi:hypothetical protein